MRLVPPIHAVAINVVYSMFLTSLKVIFAMSAMFGSFSFRPYDYLCCKKNSPLTRVWLIQKFLRRMALYEATFWNMFYINVDVQCILTKSIYHTHLPADTDSVHS